MNSRTKISRPFSRPFVSAVTAIASGWLATGLVPAAIVVLPLNAQAQNVYSTAQADDEAPTRVGRVAFVSGGVQSYSEADPQWAPALVNDPVTSRNSFFTDARGRLEIRVGPAAFSLDSNSQIDISQLDDQVFSGGLVRGNLSVRLNHMENGDHVLISTPHGQFELEKSGRYRIDAGPNGASVTVFAGRAQALVGNGSMRVDEGKSLRVSNGSGGESFMFVAASNTEFDGWALARDQRYREGPSVQYVSRNMTGYEDLDANGNWVSDPDYGSVWYPTTYVTAGWAPYRNGHWDWVAPWGWTWVDDAPWGFAPFHYGRWVSIGGRWGWTPGAYVARPVFAPALVGFYGGANFSLSVSVGGGPAVGWYPLAPWERYTPGYTRNGNYINRVNNITIVNPPARYAGRDDFNRVNGATVIRQSDFGNRRPVAGLAVRNVPDDFIRRAPVVTALPQRQEPARSGGFAQGQVQGQARPDFSRGPEWQRADDGNARLNAPRDLRRDGQRDAQRDAAVMEERRAQDRLGEMQRQQREAQYQNQQFQNQQRMEQQRVEQQRFEQQRNEQARAEQQRAEWQRNQQQRDQQLREQQRDQQWQQRDFERRVAPVRMEPLSNQRMEQTQPQPQQPQPNMQRQPPMQRPEPQRMEQPRVEQARIEQPRAINVEQPPAPAPSRFNQVPQEQRGDNQGQRGGSRFRPPDQQ